MRRFTVRLFALLFAVAGASRAGSDRPSTAAVVVDDFESVAGWSAHPADGVELSIGSDGGFLGRALRLDFAFSGGGYAVIRKDVSLELPDNYAFSFRVRGRALPNHLEFKLLDSTGENVWWSVRRDVEFSDDWAVFRIKKRHIDFAWGPAGGGEIRQVAAIEFAVTAGGGGTGTVWIDELALTPLPPAGTPPPPPVARASSAARGRAARNALDDDTATFWSPEASDSEPSITLDLGTSREYGGVVVDWAPNRHPRAYDVEVSDDGEEWRSLRTVTGNGGRDHVYLPESESRHLRVRLPPAGGDPPALAELSLRDVEWAASRESFFGAVAEEAPRGTYPRGMSGEQSYWTVVGVDGDEREGLVGEDGAIECGRESFSIEPFLFVGGELVTWADVELTQSLDSGFLPIPSVRWTRDRLRLTVTAFGAGPAGASSIFVRYRVENTGRTRGAGTLYLALRPFQVNPPSQSLNTRGGTARVREIVLDERGARVNGDRQIRVLDRPSGFGASTFDGGDVVADHLHLGRLPEQSRVVDPFESASAAWSFDWDLPASGAYEVDVVVPLHPEAATSEPGEGEAIERWFDDALVRARAAWLDRTERFTLELPPSASPIVETLKSQLAYILVNRAGPAIRPGPRAYARSWIRDGALTSSALLRLGQADVVREFLEWYAPHQYENGKVPCVVDDRGADPVPEHDSSGEFIFLVAEHHRFTADRDLAKRMWPRVVAAADYLDSLRRERRTEEYRTPENAHFFGLLPPSISHEGYAAKPMHSYWDDFFALRGFKDATYLARELGLPEEANRLEAIRVEFERDLVASVTAAMQRHDIDYVPGCADLGDFDPTSTTIALSPAGATSLLREHLLPTFERYWDFFRERREGAAWEAYTPYEIRNVGAFVRLGWRERAHELLDYFLADRRPLGFRQWPEVVWKDARTPHFLGDLPHTWVGSDFVRSVLDLFAYEREGDSSLVVAAGVSPAWLEESAVAVRDLRTAYGPLSCSMTLGEGAVEVRIEEGLRVPAGGIVVCSPFDGPIGEAIVDGAPAASGGVEIVVRRLPARLTLRP